MQRLIDRLIGTDGTDVHEPVPDDATILVIEEMKRSLTDQQTQFAQINARASYIVTGASITAAFQSLFWIGSDAFSANSLWSVPLLVLFFGLTYAIVQAFRNPGPQHRIRAVRARHLCVDADIGSQAGVNGSGPADPRC